MKELNIKLTVKELNLILEALGHQPYITVYELIHQIQNQAKEQLNGTGSSVAVNEESDQNEAKTSAEVNSN